MPEQEEAKRSRSESLQATRDAKMEELYKGQRYTIAKEVHLEGDERFQTPFGNKGRHGYVLKNVDGNATGEKAKHIVGESMLGLIAERYGAVEVPAKERKRRTKEQKAADDAREAEEKAARKAQREAERQAKAKEPVGASS